MAPTPKAITIDQRGILANTKGQMARPTLKVRKLEKVEREMHVARLTQTTSHALSPQLEPIKWEVMIWDKKNLK